MQLKEALKKITDSNQAFETQAKNRMDQLVKPQGSLGTLEEMVIRLAGITESAYPVIDKPAVIVMCADHGVCEEQIASAPQVVTMVQAINMTKGVTGVASLAKHYGMGLYTVDIGIASPYDCSDIIDACVLKGTKNMTKGPAMSRDEAIKALEVGIQMANKAALEGANILGTGEMGIGNTTPSTAILSVLTGIDPQDLTGIGANFPIEQVPHKASVIQKAIDINKPNPKDPLDVLSKVGGLEIAGMAGIMLGGAALKIPVVIDGYISTVAALIACAIEPQTKHYLFPSHVSLEKGAKVASETLGLKPYLDLSMRLGEGSGAVLGISTLQAACAVNQHMITFEASGIKVV